MVCQGWKHSWRMRSCIKSPLYANFLMENWRQGWIPSAVRHSSYREEKHLGAWRARSPLASLHICHMDNPEGRRSRLTLSQASSRITDILFSAAHGPFLFPLQFFSGGKPGQAGGSAGGDAQVAEGAQLEVTCLSNSSLLQQRVCLQLQRHVLKLSGTGDSFFMLNEMKFPLLPHLHLNAGNL